MWFLIAILSRIFASLCIVLRKQVLSKVEPMAVSWFAVTFSLPFVAVLAWREGFPDLNMDIVLALLAASVLYISSTLFQYKAMKLADLSDVIPLTSISPIFVLIIASFPPLNERISIYSLVGIVIVVMGAYILNLKSVKKGVFEPFRALFKNRASLYMITALLLYSFSTVINKGVIDALGGSTPQFVLLITNTMASLMLLPVVLKKKKMLIGIWEHRNNFFWNALLGTIGSVMAFWAIANGDAALVNAVLRINVIFILIFSYLILKEKPKKHAIWASAVMLFGVFLVKLGESM